MTERKDHAGERHPSTKLGGQTETGDFGRSGWNKARERDAYGRATPVDGGDDVHDEREDGGVASEPSEGERR